MHYLFILRENGKKRFFKRSGEILNFTSFSPHNEELCLVGFLSESGKGFIYLKLRIYTVKVESLSSLKCI